MSCLALSTRRVMTNACGGFPKLILKAREKWPTLNRIIAARSEARSCVSRLASIYARTRVASRIARPPDDKVFVRATSQEASGVSSVAKVSCECIFNLHQDLPQVFVVETQTAFLDCYVLPDAFEKRAV